MQKMNQLRSLWSPSSLTFESIAGKDRLKSADIGIAMKRLETVPAVKKQSLKLPDFKLPVRHDKPAGTSSITLNFSGKKNNEKQAHRIKMSLKLPDNKLLRQTTSMTWSIDEHDRLIYANAQLLHFLELDRKSLNKKITELIPGLFLQELYDEHEKVRHSGLPAKKIMSFECEKGTGKFFLINIYPFTNEYNQNLLVGEAFDITSIFQVHEEITKANDRFVNLSKATTEAIWEWDIESGQVFRNEKLLSLIGGGARRGFDPAWWYSMVHPEHRKDVKEKLEGVLQKKENAWEHEFLFRKQGGEYITVLEKGFVIYERGKAVKMIGSLRDISKLKSLETELLLGKVSQKKEIAEAKIHAQEKERKQLGHELHDNVNQLLATTRLFINMIKTGDNESNELKSKACEYIESAYTEIRNISHGLVVANLDEAGIIGSFEKVLDDLSLINAFAISFDYDSGVEKLQKDQKTALLRILQEQLKNIIKYSKATSVNVSLHTINGMATLSIKDNGVGFDINKVRRGIGLSNIYERSELYNGIVSLNSASGKGCELTVAFPCE